MGIYIPNEEVRSAFVRAIKKNKWAKVIQAIEASAITSLISSKALSMSSLLSRLIFQLTL